MEPKDIAIIDGDLQDQRIAHYDSPLGVTTTETVHLPGLRTESGHQFDSIDVCYQTLGRLSPEKDNVVLVCHALSGDARVAGLDPVTHRAGWWDYHVGPGKAIDTDRFYVICSNVLGGCAGTTGPTSLNPDTGQPYAMDFPPVTVRDMVAAQVRLLDHLGIEKLLAVTGGSMGGMQALVWTVDYPERVHACIPIASCMSHTAMQIGFNEIGRQAIITDPWWNQGKYTTEKRPEHGLAVARMVGHVTYLSEFAMTKKFGRNQQRPALPEDLFPKFFSVESYLHYQGKSFVKRFDPNAYLYLTKAIDVFDLFDGRAPDELLSRVKARFLIISFDSDWLYPPSQSRELARTLKRSNIAAAYINLDTPYGHDSFLIQNPEFARVLGHFLQSELRAARKAKTTPAHP